MTRHCSRCGEDKPASQFYKSKHKKSGYYSHCKACHRATCLTYRWNNIVAERAKDRVRNVGRKRGDKPKKPKQARAHYLVRAAIKGGVLVRPDACEVCQNPHSQIEAHHDDYNKPLEVIFMCGCCHQQHHRDLKGGRRNVAA